MMKKFSSGIGIKSEKYACKQVRDQKSMETS